MRTIKPARPTDASDPEKRVEVTEAELKQALCAWRDQCEVASAALAQSDPVRLEQALGIREALRPRIEGMMGRLRAAGGASRELLSTATQLGREAATADVRLTALMEAERGRLGREIDTLRKGTGPVAAYRRPDAPNPHRLNIVR